MRTLAFAKRSAREILRDPLTLFFGLGFPAVLLLLLSMIQKNIPVPLFEIQRLAPGMAIFGLTFMTLFSATLIARDRESAFLQRLYVSPMQSRDFILGYMLPMVPIALGQGIFCFAVGALLGLSVTWNLIAALFLLIPCGVFFVALGLLFGCVLNQKQVGGICGALLTNVAAWLSGLWFDLDLLGNWFSDAAKALPFYHGVRMVQLAAEGHFSQAMPHLLWVAVYAVLALLVAILLFLGQRRRQ